MFRGFKLVPAYNEAALQEALYLHGPVAISMNAALLPFKFYSEVGAGCSWLAWGWWGRYCHSSCIGRWGHVCAVLGRVCAMWVMRWT